MDKWLFLKSHAWLLSSVAPSLKTPLGLRLSGTVVRQERYRTPEASDGNSLLRLFQGQKHNPVFFKDLIESYSPFEQDLKH